MQEKEQNPQQQQEESTKEEPKDKELPKYPVAKFFPNHIGDGKFKPLSPLPISKLWHSKSNKQNRKGLTKSQINIKKSAAQEKRANPPKPMTQEQNQEALAKDMI